jgi:hypothetical protein
MQAKTKPETFLAYIDMIFIYSLIWSVGATIDDKGRCDFDRYLKQ